MSLTIDPSKLKVTELREELQVRGLDTKGNKPVLVKRLKKALEEELNKELPDTSIADTSTEDLDSSQTGEDNKSVDETDVHIRKESIDSRASQEVESEADQSVNNDDPEEETQTSVTNDTENETKTNGAEQEEKQDNVNVENCEKPEGTGEDVEMTETTEANEHKGEKRKRSESSSESAHKKREKSPIREDEPDIDPEKVLLSWYDSDLNLIVDKQSFLNAKPIHEGLFGYAWAGVRTTHGISSGKARYEVKITEELKWEDFTNQRKERQEKLKEAKERREKEREIMQAKLKKEKSNNDSQATKVSEVDESAKGTEDSEEKMEVNDDESAKQAETVAESQEDNKEPENQKEEKKESEKEKEEETAKDSEKLDEKDEPSKPEEPILTHIFRTGWSLSTGSLQLGEDNFSYGYESTGKFVSGNEFKDFAANYKLGDVVGAYLNITSENVEMKFTVNGVLQPETVTIPRSDFPEDNLVMFPHVLTRNLAFELNMGTKEEPWFPNPEELADYPFVQDIEEKVSGPTRPEKREECEVVMMCGLPGSGKTHWVKEYVKSNADKQITVIGSTYLLDRMTVRGQPLKSSYNGRWSILMDKLQRCLNRLSDVAQLRRRNYILDQTNVFPSAQRRKLRAFEGFKRRAVVVVVGDEEQAKRQSLKEAQDGKDVPDDAILEMKANMVLPTKGELFDEVIFSDLSEEDAKAQITKYNNEGKAAGYQPGLRKPPQGYNDIRGQWNYKRNDYNRGGNFRDNRFQRYDRGPRGWGQPPPPGRYPPGGRRPPPPPMAGGRDWRNNRGPPMRQGVMDRNGRPPASNYNRNRPQQGTGGRSGGWQSGGGGGYGGQSGGWSGGQQQQGSWGSGGNQGWSGGGYQQQGGWNQQNQWQKYGGQQQGGGYGAAATTGQQQGYGQNWNNYYGQYAQSWTGQGQQQQQQQQGGANQYAQWAQYAQQYAQGQNARYANAAMAAKK